MKLKLQVVVIVAIVLACGFSAGYVYRGELNLEDAHRAFVSGQRDVTTYVEDCTLDRARANQCVIPCSSEHDCVAKNGGRGSY